MNIDVDFLKIDIRTLLNSYRNGSVTPKYVVRMLYFRMPIQNGNSI